MKRFAALYEALDRAASANEKVAALAAYFTAAPPEDAAWAVSLLTGRPLKRLLPSRRLAGWAMEEAAVPDWLFEECHAGVGDLAETVALLVEGRSGARPGSDLPLSVWLTDRILPLASLPREEQRQAVVGWWGELSRWEALVLNKLLTGSLRAGVSPSLVEKARGGSEPAPPELEEPEPVTEPYHFDAVLLYAQPGQDRLLSSYTFAVWSAGELVTVAKAEAGLSGEEILTLDGWIRRHTVQRFGPVRSVEPVHVFEIACAAIAPSSRHRSGVAVRSPRIARWRTDKRPEDAGTLEQVRALAQGLLT